MKIKKFLKPINHVIIELVKKYITKYFKKKVSTIISAIDLKYLLLIRAINFQYKNNRNGNIINPKYENSAYEYQYKLS